jgi:hypothetical protein
VREATAAAEKAYREARAEDRFRLLVHRGPGTNSRHPPWEPRSTGLPDGSDPELAASHREHDADHHKQDNGFDR